MKKIYHLLFLAIMVCMSLTSCSSDDVVKTPLDTPSIIQGETKVSSLSFSWQAVSGATQYAYELYDANEQLVKGDVISTTSMIITGLMPNSTYTLKVWAYAALTGDKSTSPIATLTATTNATIALGTPVPEVSSSNGRITIVWPSVEHATSYSYTYKDESGKTVQGETNDNSITLFNLAIGTYTMTITATSSDETYTNSAPITFTFERTKSELWRKTGTYTSASLQKTFNADIVAYEDGSYAIEAPYGEEGYSISFTVPEGGTEISPLSTEDYGYYPFWVQSEKYVYIYPGSGYSNFTGNKNSGEVWFYAYLYDADGNKLGGGYDDFTWTSSQTTLDDLCGTYAAKSTGTDYFSSDYSLQEVDRTDEVTISKNDDGTLNIYNFYGWEDNFTATVDLSARTITIQPKTDWAIYYTFADISSASTAVVGTINDDLSVTFQNFTAWYGSYYYIENDMHCVMTKK